MKATTEPTEKELWAAPEVKVTAVIDNTLGDPTISDDSLGDGLFS